VGLNFSFDIDGVISKYPLYFLEFAKERIGEVFLSIDEIKVKIGEKRYSELKHDYRVSDFKYRIPIESEIIDLSREVYRSGSRIFVHSSRPFHAYSEMMEQTTQWLRNCGFYFEAINSKTVVELQSNFIDVHIDDEELEINRLIEEGLMGVKFCLFSSQHHSESFNKNLDSTDSLSKYFKQEFGIG
jgi:hypothetical protein